MKGKPFATFDEIKSESKNVLVAIPKNPFHKCLEDWKKRWYTCIMYEGYLFEGGKMYR